MTHQECQGAAGDGWWEDAPTFFAELHAHGSCEALNRAHPERSASQYRRWRRRHEGVAANVSDVADVAARGRASKPDDPSVTIDGDEARIVSEASPQLGDVETLIRGRGLDPQEWDIERVKVNEWEAYAGRDADGEPRIVKLHQLTVHLKRRRTWDFLLPANAQVSGRIFARPKTSPRVTGRPWLVWVGGDQQAGYHDELLHRAVCLWLRDVQPDELALTGDTVDFPTISRHDDRPHWSMSPQECLDAAYVLLYDYRDAAPDARARKLRGNHDWRLESEMLKRAERLYGLRPAKKPDEEAAIPLYSIRRLLRLDELAIELCGVEGDKWEFGEIEIRDDLVVRHRPPSQMKVARLARSVVAGDSHIQAVQHVEQRGIGDEWVTRTLMQVGTLADRRGGLGYAVDANWQQGFGTVAIYPDGTQAFDLARWNGRALTWRGETWKP